MSEASPPVGRATPPADATPPGTANPTRGRIPIRATVHPIALEVGAGFPLDHPYVRMWWTCVLGPTAVADLLRLGRAAAEGRPIRHPRGLPHLLAAGLVRREGSVVVVPTRVPAVSGGLVGRIPVPLRDRHRRQSEPPRLAG